MLKTLDKIRLDVSTKLNVGEKSRLGQFMTPATVAGFMASLFTRSDSGLTGSKIYYGNVSENGHDHH